LRRRASLLLAGLFALWPLRPPSCTWAMGARAVRYYWPGRSLVNHGTERCISFGGLRADHAVGQRGSPGPGSRSASTAAVEGASRLKDERDTSRQEETRYGAAAGALLGGACPPAILMLSIPPIVLVAGELGAPLERGVCRRCTRIEGEIAALEARKPAPLGREGEAAFVAAWRRSRSRLVRIRLRQQRPARRILARRALHENCLWRIEGGLHPDDPALGRVGTTPRLKSEDQTGAGPSIAGRCPKIPCR